MPSASASKPSCDDLFPGLPVLRALRSLTVSPGDCGADLRRLHNTQDYDFAFVFEVPSDLRPAPLVIVTPRRHRDLR